MTPPPDSNEPPHTSTASFRTAKPRTPDERDPLPLPEPPTAEPRSGSSFVMLMPASSAATPLPPPRPVSPGTDEVPTYISPPRPAEPTMPAAAGQRLGHYEILEAIGAGGMAAVLKARDTELGRVVALKILPPNMARDPENVTRFKQEARAAARLDHDHVARVFSCGEDKGLHFIAFEFVDGDNLRMVIDRAGVLAPAEAVRLMAQVAAGLQHAADRGVVHRDIKPSNIIVGKDGRAKIVDMGLARAMGTHSINGGVTQSGVTLGTFDYISPEQALDPRRADIRSDIYSLGCAFYHALTGRPPVPEGTAAKKLHAHQHEPVVDPRVINPAVPDDLAAVLAKMMAKDVNRRYQSPDELIADLRVIARRLNLAADALPTDAGGPQSGAGSRHRVAGLSTAPPRVPLGPVLAAAGVAIAAAVLFGLAGGGKQPTAPPWDDAFAKAPPPTESALPTKGPTPSAEPPSVVSAKTVEDLAKAAAQPGVTQVRLEPGKRYDLTALPAGVLVRGKPFAILGVGGLQAPIIRLAAVPPDPVRPTEPRPGSLTVSKAESVRFEGIRFEIADHAAGGAADDPVAVAIDETPKVEVVGCRFETDADARSTAAAGLSVGPGPRGEAVDVAVANSYFAVRRGTGVRFAGRIRAEVSESAFAPHPACFRLGPDSTDSTTSTLSLRSCSFLLEKGSVADADEGAKWQVSAGYCVFAMPPPPDPDPATMMGDLPMRRPCVLRVPTTNPARSDARFAGKANQRNVYFRVDAISAAGTGYTLDECKALATNPAPDPSAAIADRPPWELADPIAALATVRPWDAFRLRTTSRIVRIADVNLVLTGARSLPTKNDKIYPAWPPPAQADPLPARVKVWWPNPPADEADNLRKGEYQTIDEAVAALNKAAVDNPDDKYELQVRYTGVLPLKPVIFDNPKLRVTVKPYPGSSPILVPAASKKLDASLFRLEDGDLALEGLEFRIRSRADSLTEVRSRAVVTVVTGKRCVLSNCSVTADDGSGDPTDVDKLAAVVVADPDGEMKANGADRRPEIRIENCVLRGAARGTWIQASRPVDVAYQNTLAALAGPLLLVEGPSKAAAGGTVHVRLSRVTSISAGPTFDLRASSPLGKPGWTPILLEADRSVFSAIGRATIPFLISDGVEPLALESCLTWGSSDGANWYAGRAADTIAAELVPSDTTQTTKHFTTDDWLHFTGEKADASLGKVTFALAPTARKLAAVRPADLKVTGVDIDVAANSDAGADVSRLPKPTDEAVRDR